jgi:hypothetical protein
MENTSMTIEKFWSTIENAKLKSKDNLDEFTKIMSDELSNWSYSDLYHFQTIYEKYETAVTLYANNLIWSALIIINKGYCTNTYGFAGWLIANGKEAYLNTLKNADYLAKTDAKKDKCNFEGIRFMAIRLAKTKMNGKIKQTIEDLNKEYETEPYKNIFESINSEIEYGNLKRNRDWTLKEMKPFLPELYKKHIEMKKFWKIF